MNRKNKIHQMRKNIMRMGKIIKEEKHEEGYYSIEVLVNGYHICSPDDSKYMAYKGCQFACKWAACMPEYHKPEKEG